MGRKKIAIEKIVNENIRRVIDMIYVRTLSISGKMDCSKKYQKYRCYVMYQLNC